MQELSTHLRKTRQIKEGENQFFKLKKKIEANGTKMFLQSLSLRKEKKTKYDLFYVKKFTTVLKMCSLSLRYTHEIHACARTDV